MEVIAITFDTLSSYSRMDRQWKRWSTISIERTVRTASHGVLRCTWPYHKLRNPSTEARKIRSNKNFNHINYFSEYRRWQESDRQFMKEFLFIHFFSCWNHLYSTVQCTVVTSVLYTPSSSCFILKRHKQFALAIIQGPIWISHGNYYFNIST